jgi:hypothetical protein
MRTATRRAADKWQFWGPGRDGTDCGVLAPDFGPHFCERRDSPACGDQQDEGQKVEQ